MKKVIFLTAFVLFTLISCNNLQWSNKASFKMDWNEAIGYCENLYEDGHNDWRLPNIDELRTLIKAPETISGGKCQISEKAGKLSDEYWTYECNILIRNGIESGNSSFWSYSITDDDNVWIMILPGYVTNDHKSFTNNVICVR